MRQCFTIKLSDEERAELRAAAKRFGLPVTTWSRRVLIGAARRPVVTGIDLGEGVAPLLVRPSDDEGSGS